MINSSGSPEATLSRSSSMCSSRTVDRTVTPPAVTLSVGGDPAKNDWNLGPGSDPVPDIVGQGAYCLAGKVGLPVEQREAPLLDGQVAGSAVGGVADELGPSLGLGGRCG